MEFALSLYTILAFNSIKLVTLGNHSEESVNIMGSARKIYEAYGFKSYKEETFDFGEKTRVGVLWYELKLDKK